MSYEDFDTFFKTDPETELDIETSYTLKVLDQNFNASSYLYGDYEEIGGFPGDFTHRFEFCISSCVNPLVGLWCVSNNNGGYESMGEDEIMLVVSPLINGGDFVLNLQNKDGSIKDTSVGLIFTPLVHYFIGIKRIGSIYFVTIRTGGHSGDIVDELGIDAGAVVNFKYLYIQFELLE